MRKYTFFLIAFVICLTICLADRPIGPEAIFFDVGQGDALAFRTPGNKIILVDGGPDLLLIPQLAKWMGYRERVIDMVILSHDHDDHSSALPEIVERYEVLRAVLPAQASSSETIALIKALDEDGVEIIRPNQSKCIDLEPECSICILVPLKQFLSTKDLNNTSFGLHFNCAGLRVAAAGDATKALERSYLVQLSDWQADVFKASHHGSDTSNDETFIGEINPALMVISVGINNSYGHPSAAVINRARGLGVGIWQTDKDSSVRIYAKDKQIFVESWP
ncbi:hypothetical protein CVU83_01800 [Candidatus Falkowbacteria bacterium HGW-Falkowbacteria-2]|uniref:Metallo-beta-lactamase domain-containing protein n=1 Tax=Candidatus Falkowbacteria bacterium HGW-Falkowbacteria-2 TaxID=2013769 RepID=A0A2N2E0Z0_9BACT|nr:MAG: hypothetical protein CVU83_01800 [Candidatus Falkowbacteria bacterium HGW-Falkowbacteria-2]